LEGVADHHNFAAQELFPVPAFGVEHLVGFANGYERHVVFGRGHLHHFDEKAELGEFFAHSSFHAKQWSWIMLGQHCPSVSADQQGPFTPSRGE
jgi:hypothetical protein